MVYEGVWFNTLVILKYNKDAESFSNNVNYQHHWKGLNEGKRKERLKELFNLCQLIHSANNR